MKLDDYLVSKGKAAFKKLIDNAQDYDDYVTQLPKKKNKPKMKKKNDGPSAYEIAERLCREEKLIFSAESFYAYRDGVYKYCPDEIIRQAILKFTGKEISFAGVAEILSFAKTCVFREPERLNESPLLNLKNGLFDVDTYRLSPHSPEVLSTIQLPVSYESEARCDKFGKTLDEIFEGDEEKIMILQEFWGLCLTRETKFEHALICLGEGANGKSLLLNVLEHILGKQNCCSIPLEKFNNTHYVANLFGKLANISVETSAKSEVYDSIFKSIVSGDPIQADLKFKNPFKFNPFCKLVFAMNNLPRVDDKTRAFYRRLIILRFGREFSETEQNKNLKNELLMEINGIFLWCLLGLKRLRQRGHFKIPKQIQDEVEEYQKENNNVIIFVDDKCKLDDEFSIGKRELYTHYSNYCRDYNYRAFSKKKFGMELKKQFKNIKDDRSNSSRSWEGIEIDITK